MKKNTMIILAGLTLIALACTRGPQPPELIQPDDQATLLNLPFVWRSSPEAVQYQFEIDQDPNFPAPVISEIVSDTSYSLPAATYDVFVPFASYYWHVYASDGENWGEASEVRSFTVTGGGKD